MKAIRLPAAFERIGVKKTSGYALIKRGELPQPTVITGRIKVLFEDEIDEFLAARRAASADEAVRNQKN
jgi:predicted DNA-binding transcriptional regulator AlpA